MPTIDIENYDPAVEPYGDKLHRLARVAFSFIPTCAELFSTLVEDPYNSRVKIWLSDLTNELNNAIIDIEEIKNNEKHNNAILSSIMQSTEIALRTSDKEMHENLIQFILNTIHNQDSDEELNMIYLSTLRQLTVSHLSLLKLIKNRKRYEHGTELKLNEETLINEIKSCMKINQSVPSTRLLNDLVVMQLIYSPPGSPWSSNTSNYSTMMISDFAKQLIHHIEKI